MTPNLSASDGINIQVPDNILSDFTVGMKVTVLLKNVLRNGRVMSVSLEDGINVKYENGDEGSYLANQLKKMIELGEARVRQEQEARVRQEEASARETKEIDASMDVQEWLRSNFNIKTNLSAALSSLSIRTMYDLGNISNESFGTLANAMLPIEKRRWMKTGKEKLAVIRGHESKVKEQRADHDARDRQRRAAQQQQRAKNHDEEMKEIKETASKAKVRALSRVVYCDSCFNVEMFCSLSLTFSSSSFFPSLPFSSLPASVSCSLLITEHHGVDGECWSARLSKIVVGRARLHGQYH